MSALQSPVMIGASVQRLGSLLTALSTRARIGRAAPHLGRKKVLPAFEDRARELLEGPPVVAGSVQLVGFAEARQQLGSAWARVAQIAPAIAETVIRRHLSGADTFARHDEETFIICFAEPDAGKAEASARRIAATIKQALLKADPTVGELPIEHFVAALEPPVIDPEHEPLVDAFAAAIRRVKAEAEQQVREWRQRLLRDAFVLYSPLFDPERRAAAFFRCLVDEQTGRSALQRLSAIASEAALREAIFEIDCLIISRATVGLHEVMQTGGMTKLLVPVTYHTLSDARFRGRYAELCADIPEAYRQHLLFEFHGAPASTSGARILELATEAGRLGGGAVVEAHPSLGRLDELPDVGLFGVTLNAVGWAAAGGDLTARLTRGTAAARAAKLRTFVYGAETNGVVDAAIKARINFIGGKALAPAAPEPRPGTPFPVR